MCICYLFFCTCACLASFSFTSRVLSSFALLTLEKFCFLVAVPGVGKSGSFGISGGRRFSWTLPAQARRQVAGTKNPAPHRAPPHLHHHHTQRDLCRVAKAISNDKIKQPFTLIPHSSSMFSSALVFLRTSLTNSLFNLYYSKELFRLNLNFIKQQKYFLNRKYPYYSVYNESMDVRCYIYCTQVNMVRIDIFI